jgi:serralysin
MILHWQRGAKVPKARLNIIRGSHPSAAENQTTVATIQAVGGGAKTYSIVAGNDGAKFSIVGASGVLTFVAPPDYETPTDADANNIYLVTVKATDGTLSDERLLFVTVTNVAE